MPRDWEYLDKERLDAAIARAERAEAECERLRDALRTYRGFAEGGVLATPPDLLEHIDRLLTDTKETTDV